MKNKLQYIVDRDEYIRQIERELDAQVGNLLGSECTYQGEDCSILDFDPPNKGVLIHQPSKNIGKWVLINAIE